MSGQGKRLQISVVQVVAGAAAAATAAFAASISGVGGTVIGAALVSAVFTVLFAIYEHSLRQARERLAVAARPTELIPVVPPVAVAPAESAVPADAGEDDSPSDAEVTLEMQIANHDPLGLEGNDGYHWRRITLVALAVFGAAMAFVTTFELVTGRPLASLFGHDVSGTTIVRVFRPQPAPTVTQTAVPTPTPGSSTSTTPSPTPTPSTTTTPTPTPTPSTTTTPTPTPTPSTTTSRSPTPTPTPSGSRP
jgi:cell division septation protein DedD